MVSEHRNDLEKAEAMFREELVGFVRTINARSRMLLEAAEQLERRRAIVERAAAGNDHGRAA